MKPLYLVLVILACECSCRSVSSISQTITIESEQIPPDMATEEFILIGKLHNKSSYDKQLKIEFSLYTGQYVLATREEIKENYASETRYRYVLDCDIEEKITNRNSLTHVQTKTYSYRYYIFDRITGQTYNRTGSSRHPARQIRAYIMAIEAIRKK